MKKLFKIVLILIFLIPVVKAQESTPAVELFFITEDAPSSPIITCTLSAQSQCWGIQSPQPHQPGNYFLTDTLDNATYVPEQNNWGASSEGFDFITSLNGYDTFGYGIYKVTSNGTNKYFYLDYRDYRIGWYGNYSPPSYGHNIDLSIKYDYDDDSLTYSSGSPDDYHGILSGQLLNLWDIKQKGTQLTRLFPDYWENSLAAINNGDYHPNIVWGPYPESLPGPIVKYRIFYDDHPSYIPPGSFSFLAEVGATVYNYIDETVLIGSGFNKRSYIVKAVYIVDFDTYIETNPTNTASVNLRPASKIQVKTDEENLLDYYLLQNYPNPFNPNTMIEYSVKNDGLVILEVYDILGKKVSVLVNERKSAGKYFAEFNASDLPSGVYFYKFRSANFIEAKKMLLTK